MRRLLLCWLLVSYVMAQQTNFDFIVIGAGTAGSSVAERLSRNSDWSVVVLDTGYDLSQTQWTTPSLYTTLSAGGTATSDFQRQVREIHTYEPKSSPIRGLETFNTEGTLGGASALNGNFPARLNSADHDLWVTHSGNSAWSFANTNNDWKELENWKSTDPTNAHGHNGPVTIQTFQERATSLHNDLKTRMSQSLGIPNLSDGNLGTNEGVSFGARNIESGPTPTSPGIRQDAWTRILKPALNRTNLVLKEGSKVIHIGILDGRAINITYIQHRETKVLTANKEIIVCAGVFESPKLLMLSGIGPAKHLQEMSIPVQVNNSNVGQHLKGNIGYLFVYGNALPADPNIPYGVILSAIFKSGYSTRTDLEISASLLRGDQVGASNDVIAPLLCQNVLPVEGEVKLRNNNPFYGLNVTYGFFDSTTNILPMINGFRKVRTMMSQTPAVIPTFPFLAPTPLSLLTFVEVIPGISAVPIGASDDTIATFLKANARAEWHDTSTCKMGTSIQNGVVDWRLRVFGVPNLRVVDNSAAPETPSSHSAAASAFLLGRVGGRFIYEDNI